MEIEFDPAKNARNIKDRGLVYACRRIRLEHGYDRAFQPPRRSIIFAIGYIGSRLHALVFTKSGATVRVISLCRPIRRR